MAVDWIKMRSDLQSHPKVVRILSATRTDKFRVIGGLHAVWAVFDAHTVDGILKGYTPDLLDHVIGWDGFSRAMESVGWLLYDGIETLTLPEFGTHNGQSAKRRAEDQKRKQLVRKCPQSVRNLSADDEDKNRTREEKKREENKEQKQGADAPDHLADLPADLARDFRAVRRAKKAPITETAIAGIRREAEKAGLTFEAAVRLCCERGWTAIKADWPEVAAAAKRVPPAQQKGGGRIAL